MDVASMARGARLVTIPCPVCGSYDEELALRRNGFRVVRCTRCRFLFANPRPDPESLAGLYRDRPHLANGRDGRTRDDPEDARKDALYRLARLAEFLRTGRVLDVGCGRGDFLALARARFDVHGVDVAPRLRDPDLAPRVRTGTLAAVHYPDGWFHAVTVVEVLEHVFDPRGELREVRRVLSDRGVVLLQTGDAGNLMARVSFERWPYVQPPVHLNFFDRRSLARILQSEGFRILRGWSFGRAPTRFPGSSRLADPEILRPLADLGGRVGLIGQMYAAAKSEAA